MTTANTTPALVPTNIDDMFGSVQGTSNASRPMMARGTLLRLPTREKMLGVVVLRNQSEE